MKNKLFVFFALCTTLSFSGCKDDEPSQIPTVPTTFGLEDGAVIEELNVTLNASGSTVEDNGLSVSYVYYIGKSADALEETSAEVTLEPYTQYFWCAQAKTEAGDGERTEIRKFYCVPPLSVETDNGDGEWAAVVRFKGLDKKIANGKVTAVSDSYQYEFDIEANQDSCYLKAERISSDENNIYKHWWDDQHGVYYDPIVYTFNIKLNITVGDTTISVSNIAKECILNKQECVRDHEFNVYRVVKIGNRKWLADDLRVQSVVYDGDTIQLKDVLYSYYYGENQHPPIGPTEVKLAQSGSVGYVYRIKDSGTDVYYKDKNGDKKVADLYDILKLLPPKGYHISNNSDWEDLERFYGIENPQICLREERGVAAAGVISQDNESVEPKYDTYFQGDDIDFRSKLASQYDWAEVPTSYPTLFNAKPFNIYVNEGIVGCIYYTLPDPEHNYRGARFRILVSYNRGIINFEMDFGGFITNSLFRCVKDK